MTIYLRGRSYKDRPLNLILNKISELEQIRADFHRTHGKPWFQKCLPLKKIWGIIEGQRTFLSIDADGYSTNSITSIPDQALIADAEELPLMITEPVWEPVLDIIQRRLKGTIDVPPRRQDLIDEYTRLQCRSQHVIRVLGIYEELLFHILQEMYHKEIYDKHWGTKLFVLSNGSRSFYVLLKNHSSGLGIELLSSREIIHVEESILPRT